MNIYVGNLSHAVTEQELRSLFAEFGEVKSAKIIKDQISGEPRGFAFVEIPDNESGTKAIAGLEGTEFAGRRLKVNEAKPKSNGPRVYNSFSSPYGYKNRFEKY
jgi:RNA recognition motif-containing protein